VSDLRALAQRYCELETEIETVRRAMLATLSNGAGTAPARPTRPAGKSGGKRQSREAVMEAAQLAEAEIVRALNDHPMATGEIARHTQAKTSTTVARLQRMQERGTVSRSDEGMWSATATP
jgi:hypothetical protein